MLGTTPIYLIAIYSPWSWPPVGHVDSTKVVVTHPYYLLLRSSNCCYSIETILSNHDALLKIIHNRTYRPERAVSSYG
jgi:hypothetical protein